MSERKPILLAIPVHNEARHIAGVLEEARRHAPAEILVIDDGSRDATPRILSELSNRIEGLRVERHESNRGYGAALATAFRHALDGDWEGLVTMDCDGQHQPSRIPEIAARLDDADIVSGSRYLENLGGSGRVPEDRRRINRVVTAWLNAALGLRLTDAFCGFKGYSRRALRAIEITEPGYAMPLQVWTRAVQHGLRIVEVAVELIYLDESRAFGGALDDAEFRLRHYRGVLERELRRAGFEAPDWGAAVVS